MSAVRTVVDLGKILESLGLQTFPIPKNVIVLNVSENVAQKKVLTQHPQPLLVAIFVSL